MSSSYQGGCLCGRVRYTAKDPVMSVLCHCTHCQKTSGSAFSTNVLVADANFTLSGTTKAFHDKGDSGKSLDRHFCPECGSALFTRAEALPNLTIVKAGSLDDPSWVQPASQIYCDSSQAWVKGSLDMKAFAKGMA
jgi:hypothetical protein